MKPLIIGALTALIGVWANHFSLAQLGLSIDITAYGFLTFGVINLIRLTIIKLLSYKKRGSLK